MKHFPFLFLMCITFLSFNAPDIPVPGRNDVSVGGTAVKLVDRELILDYEIRFGSDVTSCDVDVIVLADKVPYRFTKYYSGDFGRVTSPGRKQVRFNIAPHKELLAGKDIKFRIDVIRRELSEGRPIEAVPAVTMPEVVTSSTTSISSDSAVCSGTVISDGGSTVTAKGFVWSTEPNPTISLKTKTNAGKGSGDFSSTLSSLESSTKYYVRAYATNAVGTVYGSEYYFVTMFDKSTVATANVSSVSMSSAVLNGTIISDGGEPPHECGFYWSSSPFSDGSSASKQPGTISGTSFSASLTGLAPSTEYYYQAYSTNSAGTSKGEVLSFKTNRDLASAVDLSSGGTANCYMVSASGAYRFSAVKGNSPESVGQAASAEVLWETFGTSESLSKGDLIGSVSYSDGFVTFLTADTFREGNALIAVRDASGNILWSWHIWLTDQPKGQTYNNGAGVMMDRNLGATSATPGDVGALGLLYQWGRKDPFLGSSSIRSSTEARSTITWPSPVSSSSSTGTISFATSHPTTFIKSNSNNYDWYYSTDDSTDDTRWRSSKTTYDPCPAGWRVPDGGSKGVWSKAFGTSSSWETSSNRDSSNKGMDFSRTDKKLGSSGPIWYPASGFRDRSSGFLYNVGSLGRYWSASPSSLHAYSLYFGNGGGVNPSYYSGRASGQSVRCLQE